MNKRSSISGFFIKLQGIPAGGGDLVLQPFGFHDFDGISIGKQFHDQVASKVKLQPDPKFPAVVFHHLLGFMQGIAFYVFSLLGSEG